MLRITFSTIVLAMLISIGHADRVSAEELEHCTVWEAVPHESGLRDQHRSIALGGGRKSVELYARSLQDDPEVKFLTCSLHLDCTVTPRAEGIRLISRELENKTTHALIAKFVQVSFKIEVLGLNEVVVQTCRIQRMTKE